MNTHDANTKLGQLLRKYYQTEGRTRAEAKGLTLGALTTKEKNALIEPIMDQFLRSLDAEHDTGLIGRVTVRAGNTAGMSEGRSSVIKAATEMFKDSKIKSFSAEVATLREVAKEPLWLGNSKWVTLGTATFAELELGRQYSEKLARGHETTAKKINEIQRIILKAKKPTLNETIEFVDANGDEAEDILNGLELMAV